MLTTTPPEFSAIEAERVAKQHFGIRGRVSSLVSERDQNFRLDAEDGQRFVLKISNPAEQAQTVDFQNQALLYMARQDADLPIPRVTRDLSGNTHCCVQKDGESHLVRVLTWLDGETLGEQPAKADLVREMGKLLARLGLALNGFEHPGSDPPSLWDMKRASGLRELLPSVGNPELRLIAGSVLDAFDEHVMPRLETLRTQVIHNDLNPGNVLMEKSPHGNISGVIDFGDLVKSPLIIDLAVAAAYQLRRGDDPMAGALPMIAGYHSVRPLETGEIDVLGIMIRTRLVTSLLIGSYRAELFPENREYLLISQESVIEHLYNLRNSGASDRDRLLDQLC